MRTPEGGVPHEAVCSIRMGMDQVMEGLGVLPDKPEEGLIRFSGKGRTHLGACDSRAAEKLEGSLLQHLAGQTKIGGLVQVDVPQGGEAPPEVPLAVP